MDAKRKGGNRLKSVAARREELEEFCSSDWLSLQGLKERIEHLSWEDLSDSPFLHWICANSSTSHGVVEFVLDEFPEAVFILAHPDHDTEKAFPIHAACANDYCPDSVIRLLVAKNPDALSQKIEDGHERDVLHCEYRAVGSPLYHYLRRSSSSHILLDTVKLLVETDSDALKIGTVNGLLPIHGLLLNKDISALYGILEYILQTNPSCASIADDYDNISLHYACLNEKTTLETVRILVNVWPTGIFHSDSNGKLPIHIWCSHSFDDTPSAFPIFALFFNASPLCVGVHNYDGDLPIGRLVLSPKFLKAVMDAFPGMVKYKNRRGDLLIHKACREGSLESVKDLLHAYPESIDVANNDGYLPIHKASECWGEEKVEKIKFLLSLEPSGASKTTTPTGGSKPMFPLHIVCMYDTSLECQYALGAAKLLYDAHPEAIFQLDGLGQTPLDIARTAGRWSGWSNQSLINFLETNLIHAQNANDICAMATRDANGRLPLHHVLHEGVNLGSVKLLVRGNPSALEVPCGGNRDFPLHYACRRGDPDVVKYLLGCNPSSVSKLNGERKLPIHLLLEAEEVDRNSLEYVDAIWCLLHAHPATVSGWVPHL